MRGGPVSYRPLNMNTEVPIMLKLGTVGQEVVLTKVMKYSMTAIACHHIGAQSKLLREVMNIEIPEMIVTVHIQCMSRLRDSQLLLITDEIAESDRWATTVGAETWITSSDGLRVEKEAKREGCGSCREVVSIGRKTP